MIPNIYLIFNMDDESFFNVERRQFKENEARDEHKAFYLVEKRSGPK